MTEPEPQPVAECECDDEPKLTDDEWQAVAVLSTRDDA